MDADYMFFGFGRVESMETSIKLYEKSAELGNPKAIMALGRIFEKGLGVKADIVKAFHFYDLVAEKKEPYALYWLGLACEVRNYIKY